MEKSIRRRINITGPSGVGKTTLAKEISKRYQIPFISGSYSDLVPETREMKHSDMITQDAQKVFEQDVQVLNLRNKAFMNQDRFISDRSYLDSAAYMINKLSHRIPECDIEDFLEKCKQLTLLQCDKVIYIPFSKRYFTEWKMEDNNKRVLNRFYQAEITSIIDWLIDFYWDLHIIYSIPSNNHPRDYYPVLEFDNIVNGPKILVLNTTEFEERLNIVDEFLNL